MRADSAYSQRTPALQSVQVSIGDPALDPDAVTLGSAQQALGDPRLTSGDRQAVRHVVQAVESIHARFGYSGFDDAAGAVKLVLHYHKGPEVSGSDKLRVPATNPFAEMPGAKVRPGAILPADVAYHELVHLLQTQVSGHGSGAPSEAVGMGADVVTPAQARGVREGLADALSALDARSWQTGAGYRRQDGGAAEVARDFANPTSPHALMGVDVRYDPTIVRDVTRDPHGTGGIVVATAHELQQRLGWSGAQDVLWAVLHDADFQRSDQAWDDLAAAFEQVAAASVPATGAAIRASVHATALDTAD